MIEKLSEDDIERIENLNLFRVEKYSHEISFFVGLFYLVIIFFIPFIGWKRTPTTPPRDVYEYINRLIPYLIIPAFLIIPPIVNWRMRKIETGTVTFKSDLLFKRKLIGFKPFRLILYKSPDHFPDLKSGDKIRMELTYSGRLFNYQKI